MGVLMERSGVDVLSDVLASLQLKGRIFCRSELSAPWALGFAAGEFSHFHVIERGRCWLRLDGMPDAIALEEGDLLLVPHGHGYQLSDQPSTPPVPMTDLVAESQGGLRAVLRHGGDGARTSAICGSFEFEGPRAQSLLTVLPQWIRVRHTERRDSEWLDATMRFLTHETRQGDVGADTIITRLIDVLFVEAVRTWLNGQPAGAAGWLGALRDPPIAAALGLVHETPSRRWTVPSLAASVGMSRSPFAARFTALVGVSPMAYVQRWRMQVGATLLAYETLALAGVAERVGYESTPAFSRAFTREFGMPPAEYRRSRVRSAVSAGNGNPT